MNKNKKKSGFTLVEVIIVLAIIAVIAAIAIPNLTKVRTESKIKADTQSAESIRKTMLMLITEDKVMVNSSNTVLTLDFNEDTYKVDDILVGNNSLDTTNDANTILKNGTTADDVVGYFEGIKKPQSDGSETYKITIIRTGATGNEEPGNVVVEVVGENGSATSAGIIIK